MGPISKGIFEDSSDSESELKTENEYAKNYDVWRKKEELNKLKTKYGEDVLEASESSSSSDDDEDAIELTQQVEKDFFKTLSYLKKKDPKIYDNNVSFFGSREVDVKKQKKEKEQPMYLKDYERKLLLEKGGIVSDEENDEQENFKSPIYAKEQQHIKEDIIKKSQEIEEDDGIEGMLQVRKKTNEEKDKEADYIKWLAGQKDDIQDKEVESELKPLKDFWSDPHLDNGEKFLKDYVLNKRYLEKDDNSYVPTYDEIVHDSDNSLSGDEKEIERQEEFEHKYNFRFEEPDQEFIKRYPRTIEQSLRVTDGKRKLKRAETKERKKKEKEEKMAEIKKLQELKRKEIEEKIEKLKEVTGATDIAFQTDDLDGDFDPEAHDRRMHALFNDDFYEGPEGDQKPEFPDLDEELEIENWDHWNGPENLENNEQNAPHCEDDDFNMDADYDPQAALQKELTENSKGKKKRKRKSKVAEALNRPKPKFDPNDKNYEKYFDEYYKLECEDIIADIPCRFKYREVVPNSFGLSVEEILLAKDKELNRWCSLKKMIQRRPENVEKYDQIAYSRKANDIVLKRKLLPSLFSEEQANGDTETPSTSNIEITTKSNEEKPTENKQNKKKKNKKKKPQKQAKTNPENEKQTKKRKHKEDSEKHKQGGKKQKKDPNITLTDARLTAFGINPKKFKNKLKYCNKNKES